MSRVRPCSSSSTGSARIRTKSSAARESARFNLAPLWERQMKPPPITLSGNVPTITDLDHEAIAEELEKLSASEVLEWMFEQFGSRHYIACSFQKTSSVTAHLASQVNPDARFFYLDTDVLFPETYETRDRLREATGGGLDRLHTPH